MLKKVKNLGKNSKSSTKSKRQSINDDEPTMEVPVLEARKKPEGAKKGGFGGKQMNNFSKFAQRNLMGGGKKKSKSARGSGEEDDGESDDISDEEEYEDEQPVMKDASSDVGDDQLDELKKQLINCKKVMSDQEHVIRNKEKMILDLETKISTLEQEKAKLEVEVEDKNELSKKVAELEISVKKDEELITACKAELAAALELQNEYLTKYDTLKMEYDTVIDINKELQAQIDNNNIVLESKLKSDDSNNEIFQLKTDLESVQKDKDNLEVQLLESQNKFFELNNKVSNQESQLDDVDLDNEIKKENEELRLFVDTKNGEISELKALIAKLELDIENNKGNVLSESQQKEEIDSSVDTLKEKLAELSKYESALQEQIIKNNEIEAEKQLLLVTIDELNKEKEDKDSDQSLGLVLLNSRSSSADETAMLDNYIKKISNLEINNRELEHKLNELDGAGDHIHELEAKIHELETVIELHADDTNELTSLRKDNIQLQNRLNNMARRSSSSVEQAQDDLQSKLNIMEKENLDLTETINKLEVTIDDLKRKLSKSDSSDDDNDELIACKQRIDELETQMESLNVANRQRCSELIKELDSARAELLESKMSADAPDNRMEDLIATYKADLRVEKAKADRLQQDLDNIQEKQLEFEAITSTNEESLRAELLASRNCESVLNNKLLHYEELLANYTGADRLDDKSITGSVLSECVSRMSMMDQTSEVDEFADGDIKKKKKWKLKKPKFAKKSESQSNKNLYKEYKDKNIRLTTKLDMLEKEMEIITSELTNEKKRLEDAWALHKEKTNEQKLHIEKEKSRIEGLKAEWESRLEILKEQMTQDHQQKSIVKLEAASIDIMQQKINEYENMNDELESRLGKVFNTLASYGCTTSDVGDMCSFIRRRLDEIDDAVKEKIKMKETLEQIEATNGNNLEIAESTIRELQEALDERKLELSSLQNIVESKDVAISSMEKCISDANKRISDLEVIKSNRDGNDKKNGQLDDLLRKSEARVTALNTTVSKTQAELDAALNTVERLDGQIVELKANLEEKKKEIDEKDILSRDLQAKLDKLQDTQKYMTDVELKRVKNDMESSLAAKGSSAWMNKKIPATFFIYENEDTYTDVSLSDELYSISSILSDTFEPHVDISNLSIRLPVPSDVLSPRTIPEPKTLKLMSCVNEVSPCEGVYQHLKRHKGRIFRQIHNEPRSAAIPYRDVVGSRVHSVANNVVAKGRGSWIQRKFRKRENFDSSTLNVSLERANIFNNLSPISTGDINIDSKPFHPSTSGLFVPGPETSEDMGRSIQRWLPWRAKSIASTGPIERASDDSSDGTSVLGSILRSYIVNIKDKNDNTPFSPSTVAAMMSSPVPNTRT